MTQNSIQTPETFNPKCFLESTTAAYATDRCNGANDDDGDGQDDTTPIGQRWRINDPSLISLTFGAGKCICPGRHYRIYTPTLTPDKFQVAFILL